MTQHELYAAACAIWGPHLTVSRTYGVPLAEGQPCWGVDVMGDRDGHALDVHLQPVCHAECREKHNRSAA